MYNYYEEVKESVLDYINENYTKEELVENLRDREEFEQTLNEDCFVDDSVTGNGSGTWTFNSAQAKEFVVDGDNFELLAEALTEFGSDLTYITKQGWEACDVTIRCYVLGSAISEALDELCEEYEEDIEAEDEDETED